MHDPKVYLGPGKRVQDEDVQTCREPTATACKTIKALWTYPKVLLAGL